MITKELISKFYEDVESLGLKHPVAAVSKRTGFSKGNVSQYLSKKADPSENFLRKFYKEFYYSSDEDVAGLLMGESDTLGSYKTQNPLDGKIGEQWAVIRYLVHQVAKMRSESTNRAFADCLAEVNHELALVLQSSKGYITGV